MATRAPKGPNEESDDSLAIERRKADEELERRVRSDERSVDRTLSVAREAADEQRTRQDPSDVSASGSADARVAEERSAAAERLRRERVLADEQLAADRDARRRAVAAALSTERDATDRRFASERRRTETALGARDDFLATVTHDLRDLIGSVSLSAAALRSLDASGGAKTPIAREIERIERTAERMDHLVRDLLDTVALELGELVTRPRLVDAGALLRETCETLAPLAAERGISLTSETAAWVPVAWCDPERILQVLANLVGNAVKFTPRGGAIVLGLAPVRSDLRFTVTDTGPGVPPSEVAAIFGRLRRGASAGAGVGLGLYIAARFVEAHGGSIGVEPAHGRGSTFWFTLPAAPTRP